jgi:hypothetical protein
MAYVVLALAVIAAAAAGAMLGWVAFGGRGSAGRRGQLQAFCAGCGTLTMSVALAVELVALDGRAVPAIFLGAGLLIAGMGLFLVQLVREGGPHA